MKKTLTALLLLLPLVTYAETNLIITVSSYKQNGLMEYERRADDVRVFETMTQNNERDQQTVRVLSGSTAMIETGKDVLVVSQFGSNENALNVDNLQFVNFSYKKITQGYEIKPTLRKDNTVHLDVTFHQLRPDRVGGSSFMRHSTTSSLLVPLNRWVKLNGVSHEQSYRSDVVEYQTANRYRAGQDVWLRITKEQL